MAGREFELLPSWVAQAPTLLCRLPSPKSACLYQPAETSWLYEDCEFKYLRFYRQPFIRIDFDHSPEQALAVRGDEVRDVKNSPFDLLKKLPEVVIVKGQRAYQQSVEYHSARPDVCFSTIVFFTLQPLMKL